MNILLVSAHRTNPYCTGHHLQYALEQMGHTVIHLDFREKNKGRQSPVDEGIGQHKNDVDILIVWKGSDITPSIIEGLKIPTVLWYCDDLTTPHGFLDMSKFYKSYDYIYTPIAEDVNFIQRTFGRSAKFLPVGADIRHLDDYEGGDDNWTEQDIDVSFIGNFHSMRSYVMDEVQKYCMTKDYTCEMGTAYGEAGVNIIKRSKINLNLGWNFRGTQLRFFEVMARGGFLLTNECKSLDRINDKGYIATYGIHNLFDCIDYYLGHPDKRNGKIGQMRAVIRRDHLWQHRFETIFRDVGVS